MKAHPIHTDYLISEDGRVFSTKSNIYLKQYTMPNGYMTVSIKRKTLSVHRLVAETYIPNHMNKPQVNHRNGDKTDNRVENLEWSTRSENMKHAYDNGLAVMKKGADSPFAKLTERDVEDIRYLRKVLGWKQYRIAEHFGISDAQVSRIVNGKVW